MSDLPDWYTKPPLSPTQRLDLFGTAAPSPSSILTWPDRDFRPQYERVKAAYNAYPFRNPDKNQVYIDHIVKEIFKDLDRELAPRLATILANMVNEVFKIEGLFERYFYSSYELLPHSSPSLVADILATEEAFYASYEDRLVDLGEATINFLVNVLDDYAPQAAFGETLDVPQTNFIELARKPRELIHSLFVSLFAAKTEDGSRYIFNAIGRKLEKNLWTASGYAEEEINNVKNPKLVFPLESALPFRERVATYFDGTPFPEMLLMPVLFEIPTPIRFEHTHVIAGTGWGKTTLLLDQIVSDLSEPDPPGMVIIDPKGTMVEKIERLALFDPDHGALKDRLIIVNPHDVEYPPALNIFEPGSRRFRTYSAAVRQQIENNTVSLYNYIFGSIASALTARQGVAFGFVVRLLFSIPGATIQTLLELMEEDTYKGGIDSSRFKPFIEGQGRTAQSFFRHHFYHLTEYRETRQQITARLYAILQFPEFDAMFSAKLRRLDMFECMQSRKIVMVNTAKGLLGKEGSQLFGRYIIALTLGAAFERLAVPKSEWHPAYLVIDEAQEFVDEEKTQEILSQAREFNLGCTLAHQQLEGQMSEALRATLAANTSIKYAGGVGARDAAAMAKEMRCDSEFIFDQRKTASATEFACWVRGLTEHPISLTVPLYPNDAISRLPRMSDAAHRRLIEQNRKRIAVLPDERLPFRDTQARRDDGAPDSGEPSDRWGE